MSGIYLGRQAVGWRMGVQPVHVGMCRGAGDTVHVCGKMHWHTLYY